MEQTIREVVRIIEYYDSGNLYQHATLFWQGEGYYAGACSNDHCRIEMVSTNKLGDWPGIVEGYDRPSYAYVPNDAAKNYAGYEVGRWSVQND
jgi:hypothetical protein